MLLSIFVITQIALDIAARHLPRDERAPPAGHRLHATGEARRRAALSLLRAGTSPDEGARRERLLPGELRLMSNLVAAEAELAGARGC